MEVEVSVVFKHGLVKKEETVALRHGLVEKEETVVLRHFGQNKK